MGCEIYFGLLQFVRNTLLVEIPLLLKGIHAFSSVLVGRKCTFEMKVCSNTEYCSDVHVRTVSREINHTHHMSTITFRKLYTL
jgi:hypothetical protein